MKQVTLLNVDDIAIPKKRRAVTGIEAMAEAIKANGNRLINPISVRNDAGNTLIAGARRLAAHKHLGIKQIPAFVLDVTDIEAEILEIDENLERQELKAMEHSEQYGRRKQLYESLHPRTKAHVAGGVARQKAISATADSAVAAPKSFVKATAERTGVAERTIREDVQIASKIDHEARDLIRDTPTANCKTDLLKLAKVSPEVQVAAARKLKSGESKDAVQAIRAVAREGKTAEIQLKAKAADKIIQSEASIGNLPWKLVVGDCVQELKKVETGSIRLVIADPPYNIGRDYHGMGAAADLVPDAQYLAFCEAWLSECVRVLSDDGTLWLIVSPDYADDLGVIMRRKLGLHRRAWCIWYETFGMSRAGNFARSARHLPYMVKNPKRFVFNESAVLGPSARREVYGDKRADPDGKIFDDVFGVPWIGQKKEEVVRYDPLPRITGTHPEKIPDFDNQLPVALIRRLIECCSEPGDKVLDPFNGTGTTGVAAIMTGRTYLGIEKNANAVAVAESRLKGAYADASENKERRSA